MRNGGRDRENYRTDGAADPNGTGQRQSLPCNQRR